MDIDRLERTWIYISAGVLLLFLVAIVVAAFGLGVQVNSDRGRIHPDEVAVTAPFDRPGVEQTGPNQYRAVIVASAWVFAPNEIRLPRGADVEFVLTSTDVIHGFRVPNTTINVMLIPGHITTVRRHFRDPGTYPFFCHEYCGAGHHLMGGEIVIE